MHIEVHESAVFCIGKNSRKLVPEEIAAVYIHLAYLIQTVLLFLYLPDTLTGNKTSGIPESFQTPESPSMLLLYPVFFPALPVKD